MRDNIATCVTCGMAFMSDNDYGICGSCQSEYGSKSITKAAMECIRRLQRNESELNQRIADLEWSNKRQKTKLKTIRAELKVKTT